MDEKSIKFCQIMWYDLMDLVMTWTLHHATCCLHIWHGDGCHAALTLLQARELRRLCWGCSDSSGWECRPGSPSSYRKSFLAQTAELWRGCCPGKKANMQEKWWANANPALWLFIHQKLKNYIYNHSVSCGNFTHLFNYFTVLRLFVCPLPSSLMSISANTFLRTTSSNK